MPGLQTIPRIPVTLTAVPGHCSKSQTSTEASLVMYSRNSWPSVQSTQCYSTWHQTRQQNVCLFSAESLHEGLRVLLDFSWLLYKDDTNQTNHALPLYILLKYYFVFLYNLHIKPSVVKGAVVLPHKSPDDQS